MKNILKPVCQYATCVLHFKSLLFGTEGTWASTLWFHPAHGPNQQLPIYVHSLLWPPTLWNNLRLGKLLSWLYANYANLNYLGRLFTVVVIRILFRKMLHEGKDTMDYVL